MSTLNAPRERFMDGALNTASGPKIIGLVYDRIDRDLDAALVAMERRDIPRTHESLIHAQDLLFELLCMVDFEKWDHAGDLTSIYRYAYDMLVRANVAKQPGEVVEARQMLRELGDAFKQAALQLATANHAPAPAAAPAPAVEQRHFSLKA